MNDASERFLDDACLVYSSADSPQRRARAGKLLAERPQLVDENVLVAATVGAVEALGRHLRDRPACVTERGGPRGWDPLLYLCYGRVTVANGDPLAAARLLLQRGADPRTAFEMAGAYCFSALTGALGEGEEGLENQPPHPQARELAELLLDAGADPNDGQGLYNTMFREDDAWLRLLLDRGLDASAEISWDMSVEPRPKTLDFLLSYAVDQGFEERIELLLERGANAASRNPYNGRPLLVNALLAGRETVTERLCRFGATLAQSPAERFLESCVRPDREAALELCKREGLSPDPALLRDAAKQGRSDVVELLLDLGAAVDASDPSGVTALHEAALKGHVATVRVLLDRGADRALVERRFGATALGWAQHAGRAEVVELLRQ